MNKASSMRALERLGVERGVAFLRAAARHANCLAVTLINDELDKGTTLESLLRDPKSGYSLDVTPLGPSRFRIGFGCVPGPLIGDGGEWEVVFGEDGRILECSGGGTWIS